MLKRFSITAITSIALVAAGTTSSAAEPIHDAPAARAPAADAASRNPLSIAFLAGHSERDAFKSGIGGRIGYAFRNNFYVGGTFVSHFGTQDGPAQAHVSYGGGEVGYELAAGPVIVRPYLGSGVASIWASVFIPGVGNQPGMRVQATDTRFAIWPGASLLVPFDGGRAFIGVDAKFLTVADARVFNAYGTLGVAF